MAASSVTGTGNGSADNTAPPKIKNQRLLGPFGPRVLICGRDRLTDGTCTVTHAALDDYESTLVFVNSLTNNPVRWSAYNATTFEVVGTGTDQFIYMIVTMGTSENLASDFFVG